MQAQSLSTYASFVIVFVSYQYLKGKEKIKFKDKT